MTTNSQNLTFGEWLTLSGISPKHFDALSEDTRKTMRDAWQQGLDPI